MRNRRVLAIAAALVTCCLIATIIVRLQHDDYYHLLLAPSSRAELQGPLPLYYNHTLIRQSSKATAKSGLEPRGALKRTRDKLNPAWAYYDPRFGRVTIVTLSGQGKTGETVYCRYFALNGTEFKPAVKTTVDKFHFNMLVHCQRGRFAPLVSLSYRKSEPVKYERAINVTVLPDSLLDNTSLAVCMAPIYGDYHHWLLLMQFVEFHRLVGASHFFIYVWEVADSGTQQLLDYYSRVLRVATVIRIAEHTAADLRCAGMEKCRHNAQIHDCIYRSVHRFAFTAVIDIDELMTPAGGETLQQLISTFPTPDRFAAYKFRYRWILRGEDDATIDALRQSTLDAGEFARANLPALRFHRSAVVPPAKGLSIAVTKCIFRPERVERITVHALRKAIRSQYGTYNVPPGDGCLRHYRNTTAWKLHNVVLGLGPLRNTSLPDTLVDPLVRRVTRALNYLREHKHAIISPKSLGFT